MEISARLAADLKALTQALDDPDVDLEAELRAFAATARTAVGSYLGMTITIYLGTHHVSFTVHGHAGIGAHDPSLDRETGTGVAAVASLLIPLTAIIDAEADSTLVLYAATPDAFADLAADLSHVLQLDADALIVDAHLGKDLGHPQTVAGITGLDRLSTINQAVGVLLDRGYTPESARAELQRLAALDGRSTLKAAAAIVAEAGHER